MTLSKPLKQFLLSQTSDVFIRPSEHLLTAQRSIKQHIETLGRTLDDLDELSGIMSDMLEQQEAAEVIILIHHIVYVSLKQCRLRARNTSAYCMTT